MVIVYFIQEKMLLKWSSVFLQNKSGSFLSMHWKWSVAQSRSTTSVKADTAYQTSAGKSDAPKHLTNEILSLVKNHPEMVLMPVQSWIWKEICPFFKLRTSVFLTKKITSLPFSTRGWVPIPRSNLFSASNFFSLISIPLSLFVLCDLAGARYRSRRLFDSSPHWLPISVVLYFLSLRGLVRTSEEGLEQHVPPLFAENWVGFAMEEACVVQ